MEGSQKYSQLYSVGSGGSGQLLLGNDNDYEQLKCIESMLYKTTEEQNSIAKLQKEVVHFAVGGTKCLALTKNGQIYYWGEENNEKNQINLIISPRIAMLDYKQKFIQISCGWAHMLCLSDQNNVYGWGQCDHGQLGNFEKVVKNFNNPQLIDIGLAQNNKISQICAGFRQSYFVINQNEIKFCGNNRKGDAAGKTNDPIIKSLINVPAMKDLKVTPQQISTLNVGKTHSIILLDNGKTYGWGSNKYGQLGLQKDIEVVFEAQELSVKDKIVQVSCGWNHTMMLNDKLQVYTTGRGDFGQQGNGQKNNMFEFRKIPFDSEIIQIEAGSEACHVITKDKQIYVWGWNEHGNLGTGDKIDRNEPYKWTMPIKEKAPKLFCGGAAVILGFEN